MKKDKYKKFEEYIEKSVAPDPSRTYDGQNLTVMQGSWDKNMTKMLIEVQVYGKQLNWFLL